jgi:hypothetical protein
MFVRKDVMSTEAVRAKELASQEWYRLYRAAVDQRMPNDVIMARMRRWLQADEELEAAQKENVT